MPKVSVLLPTFNGEKFLAQAIESVLSQSCMDFELLIVNDASTDSTAQILSNFQKVDSRVKVWTNQQNLGLTKCLNLLLENATGEFVVRIDSDDFWTDKDKLKKQLEFFNQHPRVGLLGSFARVISLTGQQIKFLTYPTSDKKIRKQFLLHNCFVHSSIMARRQLMLDCGSYNIKEQYVEDYGLWLRMGLKTELANLPEIMVDYRINPAGITRMRNSQQIANAARLVSQFRRFYPNFWLAIIKWILQAGLHKIC